MKRLAGKALQELADKSFEACLASGGLGPEMVKEGFEIHRGYLFSLVMMLPKRPFSMVPSGVFCPIISGRYCPEGSGESAIPAATSNNSSTSTCNILSELRLLSRNSRYR